LWAKWSQGQATRECTKFGVVLSSLAKLMNCQKNRHYLSRKFKKFTMCQLMYYLPLVVFKGFLNLHLKKGHLKIHLLHLMPMNYYLFFRQRLLYLDMDVILNLTLLACFQETQLFSLNILVKDIRFHLT
jgi:hypothetical protein